MSPKATHNTLDITLEGDLIRVNDHTLVFGEYEGKFRARCLKCGTKHAEETKDLSGIRSVKIKEYVFGTFGSRQCHATELQYLSDVVSRYFGELASSKTISNIKGDIDPLVLDNSRYSLKV